MSTDKYNISDIFSKRLIALKKQGKFTQVQIANAIGVKQPTISAWENGEYLPGGEELYKLADFFKVSADYLLGGINFAGAEQSPVAGFSLSVEPMKEATVEYKTEPHKITVAKLRRLVKELEEALNELET